MPSHLTPRGRRPLRMAALAAVVMLGVAGCAGPAGTTADGPASSASPPPPEVVRPSGPDENEADSLPLGTDPWIVVSLTRDGQPVDTGAWDHARISTRAPFILAVPELCLQPRFGITEVSETSWEATPNVAQLAIGCAPDHADQAAIDALATLFDGTVEVTPPSGAGAEMRLSRGGVELVLAVEG